MKFSIAAASLLLFSSAGVVHSLSTPTPSRTQRIMEGIVPEGQTGGAGGSSTYDAFLRAEENWTRLKQSKPIPDFDDKILNSARPKLFVTNDGATGSTACWEKLRSQDGKNDYDIVVCGGTLGIFFATSLALQGHSVCVVEAGTLQGREQEWNISMDEMVELKELGVLSQEDIDAVVTTEFPGCRSGFKNKEVTPTVGGYFDNNVGYECVTPDVLNLGVSPKLLLERVKQRFLSLEGAVLKEKTRLQGVVVSDSLGAAIDLGDDDEPITARLVLDCMGNASPISRQQRFGMKPDGVCAVVGSCASGYDVEDNKIGDIIYTNTEVQDKGENGQYQYFWEAFPVGIGRNGIEETNVKTTYLFTYLDANEKRVSLETLMDDYFDLLPYYQPSIMNPEEDLDFKRVLFAYFPTYRDSPLQPHWSRVLAVGDASGIQVSMPLRASSSARHPHPPLIYLCLCSNKVTHTLHLSIYTPSVTSFLWWLWCLDSSFGSHHGCRVGCIERKHSAQGRFGQNQCLHSQSISSMDVSKGHECQGWIERRFKVCQSTLGHQFSGNGQNGTPHH